MEIKELEMTAKLALLELDEQEAAKLTKEATQILEYFSVMMEADVEGLEPTTHALQKDNRLRADNLNQNNNVDPDDMLECAPDLEDRFVIIPNVL